jgi:hypothetical protein
MEKRGDPAAAKKARDEYNNKVEGKKSVETATADSILAEMKKSSDAFDWAYTLLK